MGLPGRLLAVIVALGLAAGAIGFVAGLRVARLDEGTTIRSFAERYAAETGGRVADCVGVPGQGDVWIRVVCDGEVRRVYPVSRLGRLMAAPEAPSL